MTYADYIKKSIKPDFGVIIDDYHDRKNKDYFRPSGVSVYVGWQGAGKTLSAVYHIDKLMQIYPKAKLVTNILFNREFIDYADRIIEFQTLDELAELLVKTNNNELGVIYLIDEIQTYFNSLESKNIPPYIFTEISQQRKQRKLIIGTSQLWDRMAKPFREQANYEIHCRTIFNIFTIQTVIDAHTLKLDEKTGRSVGNIVKRGWFFHNRRIRKLYDTFQKVVSSANQMDIFENRPNYIISKKK